MINPGTWVRHLDSGDTGMVVAVQGDPVATTWIGVRGPDPLVPYDGSLWIRWKRGTSVPVVESEADVRVISAPEPL